MGSMNLTPKAGESDITPMNGNLRVQDVGSDGGTMWGTVTDARDCICKAGDEVYFLKLDAMLMRVNGQEICFIKESDVVFKVSK